MYAINFELKMKISICNIYIDYYMQFNSINLHTSSFDNASHDDKP